MPKIQFKFIMIRSPWVRVLLPFLVVALALNLRLLLTPYLQDRTPYTTFYPAVLISALFAGLWPGILALILSSLVVVFYVIPEPQSVFMARDFIGMLLFLITNAVIIAVCMFFRMLQSTVSRNEYRFRTFFEAMPLGVILVRPDDYSFSLFNKMAAQMLEYSPQEFSSLSVPKIDVALDAEAIRHSFDRVLAGERLHLETRHRTGSGRIRDMIVNLERVDIDEQALVLAILADITERKRVEAALMENEQRFRAMFDNAALGIVEVDRDDHLIAANRRAFEILGYSYDELMKLNIHQLTAPEDRTLSDEMNQKVHSGEFEIIAYEKRYLKADGSRIWVRVTVSAVRDETGKWVRSIGTFEDISERKLAEEALRLSEQNLRENQAYLLNLTNELTTKNEELQTIVNIASHDLRSPIVNIMGFSGELSRSASLLKQKIMKCDFSGCKSADILAILDSEIPEELRFIESSTHSIDQMLRSLLKVTSIVLSDVNRTPIDMNSLAARISKDFEKPLKAAGIELTVDQLPPCYADPVLTKEVLANLIDNAIKYLDPARPGKIALHGEIKGGYAIYSVEDNGRGIAPEHQSHLFKLFHRLEIDTPAEGIGLTVVRRLVNRMDGNVWLESKPAQGSKFFFSLPKA